MGCPRCTVCGRRRPVFSLVYCCGFDLCYKYIWYLVLYVVNTPVLGTMFQFVRRTPNESGESTTHTKRYWAAAHRNTPRNTGPHTHSVTHAPYSVAGTAAVEAQLREANSAASSYRNVSSTPLSVELGGSALSGSAEIHHTRNAI